LVESPPNGTGITVWLTGLPGSGKTTSALALAAHFDALEHASIVLDGDDLRKGISKDLDFSDADRDESVRRAGEIALLLAKQGSIAIVSLVSPRRAARDQVRARHDEYAIPFLEVHSNASLEVCEARDPKHLYRLSRQGRLLGMTGIDDPYEVPLSPEVILPTGEKGESECLVALVDAVSGVLSRGPNWGPRNSSSGSSLSEKS
jgi:bifunctional enzyme CysN/CysC